MYTLSSQKEDVRLIVHNLAALPENFGSSNILLSLTTHAASLMQLKMPEEHGVSAIARASQLFLSKFSNSLCEFSFLIYTNLIIFEV